MRKTKRGRTRSNSDNQKLKDFQVRMGIQFQNETLLKQALTHSSYVNEHRKKSYEDNERLEFLGDAVLELAISQYLYKKFPTISEGELTKLRASIVCEPALVEFANELGFGEVVLLGKGEEMTGGRARPALLADAFEAVIGALYLDQGLDKVIALLEKVVYPRVDAGAFSHAMDFKSQLQEVVQKDGTSTLSYQILQ